MKRISIVLTLLSLVVALVNIAAVPMASGTATLVGAGYVEGKGVVFTFHIDGKFSKSDLKGSVHVEGGANFGLDCVQVDDETVKCTASKAVAGNNVVVTWGGSTFWTYVPSIPSKDPNYCYSIWDWWDFTDYEWTDFGPYCQDEPAQAGDFIIYEVPDPTGSYDSWVEFYDVDVSDYCPSPVPYNGPAYYYPDCPDFYED